MRKLKVHMVNEGFTRLDDTWVSSCGIFEPTGKGTWSWKDVTCLRCLKRRKGAK